MDEWKDWTDKQLIEYEQRLFDEEQAGDNNWELREAAILEIQRRGIYEQHHTNKI